MNKVSVWKRACVLFVFCAATAIATPAQTTTSAPPATTFTTLYSFCSQTNCTDGALPYAGLVQGTNGKFYGTTEDGGANGGGTVFSMTAGGKLTTFYNFCSQTNCADGTNASAELVQGTNGKFYGTTENGGAKDYCVGEGGCGTVFSITAGGVLTTLHSFDGTDGAGPNALVQGTNRKFYGTTYAGGTNCPSSGCGTVFKITPGGTLTTLHSFDGTDGEAPYAGLVLGTNGKFYGTTERGPDGANGYGTVFSITPGGKLTTLYSFCSQTNCTDGEYPYAELVQGTNGKFYGTTEDGGANGGGTVFSITAGGKLTTLHSFDGTDGFLPYAALVQATDGNFNGTTIGGGANGDGTVFSITADGTLTTLRGFDGTDGSSPHAALVQDTNGAFYGTTSGGGANGDGTVFSLSVGLGPFVKTNPTAGKVGAKVGILGSNLTGASSVTFNGTAAAFTVKSKSEITTTVPTGATTGKVQVATPGGTLKSNMPFRVLP